MTGKPVYIYGLFDPETEELRYIGKADVPRKRYLGHLHASRFKQTELASWIKSLRPRRPLMMLIEKTDSEKWEEAEIRQIAEKRARGLRLLNKSAGGEQPDRSFMSEREARFYKLIQAMSVDLHRAEKSKGHSGRHFYQKMLCICITLYSLYPRLMPQKWARIRWDVNEFGQLTVEKFREHLSPRLFARIEFV